ncbi:hypothetical protein GCM10010915_11950 [Microbacterium faecale]|uniref:Helix-turn-helix domain-containing protein n=1 Tax=Microbacterium faecale TaxID=1804630 RepID=A0A916Y766_9MICO|nr:hypothetical protein [Microbacterium faecale]GGD33164.1 hypothetical protein GCM10010915_11950 [Microbacterium faecale]
MARGRPVDDETRERVREAIRAGDPRNTIARKFGLSGSTVSSIAKRAGLSFDRSAVAAATKARSVDLAAGRTRLAEKMLAASEDMLDRIDDPYLVFSFGGKENAYNEHTLASAPVDVRRNVITTAGIVFDKLTRIVEKDNGGLEQAVGVLDQIADGFKAAAEKYRSETVDEPVGD